MKRRKTKKAERKAVKELSTGYQLSREILDQRRGGGVRGLTNTFTYTPTDSARLGGA
ncbi:MAG: hypothetical protein KC777_14770 [Cyanobacteria bacterium HKST-UBA02]|nr:hypothetical protein [Cyanobacteria bacterium HKST-UBA02]